MFRLTVHVCILYGHVRTAIRENESYDSQHNEYHLFSPMFTAFHSCAECS